MLQNTLEKAEPTVGFQHYSFGSLKKGSQFRVAMLEEVPSHVSTSPGLMKQFLPATPLPVT